MGTSLMTLRDSLARSREREPSGSWSLDPQHFTSEEFYRHEVEEIFSKEWICVGHAKEIPHVGDYFSVQLVDEPLLIVRNKDGDVRAMSSVCRHRMMLVVKPGEIGNTSQFICPYHRWSYGLDGQLEKALCMEHHQDFDSRKIALPSFRVEIWNDLIWVNLDDEAEPLSPKLIGLEEVMAVYKGPTDGVMAALYDKSWKGNWKSQVENNLEGYHHMGMHEQSIETYAPTKNVTNLAYTEHWTRHQVHYERNRDVTERLLQEADWEPNDWLGMKQPALDIINIHPGNSFSIYPGGAGFYSIWPLSVDRFQFRARSIRAPGELRRFDSEGQGYDSERVLDEDGLAMKHIQAGARSRKAQPGPLSWMESSLTHWHRWMTERLC